MRKVFATDIDSTLLDMERPFDTWISMNRGKGTLLWPPSSHMKHWDIQHSLGVPKSKVGEFWEYVYSTPMLPYVGAQKFILDLQQGGWSVVGVSTRHRNQRDASIRDCKILGLNDLLFTENAEDKANTVGRLGAEYFLDDNLSNVWAVVAARVFLLNRPWNQSLDLDAPYKRVYGYGEVLSNL